MITIGQKSVKFSFFFSLQFVLKACEITEHLQRSRSHGSTRYPPGLALGRCREELTNPHWQVFFFLFAGTTLLILDHVVMG